MEGRCAGSSIKRSLNLLSEDGTNWAELPYSEKNRGSGGSMRSACIGLVFFDNIPKLIAVSIEAGRITHHNPFGYLGSMVSSYFTALAIQKIPPIKWIGLLFEEAFVLAEKYIKESGRSVEENINGGFWGKFVKSWEKYA